jgi:ribonucleoside-diphosphate reductase alpha chain
MAFRIPSDYSSDQIAQKVISQLRGIGGAGSTGFGADRVRSLADAVAKVIELHQASKIKDEPEEEAPSVAETMPLFDSTANQSKSTDICPECGAASLRFIEGCQKCELCGYSKC